MSTNPNSSNSQSVHRSGVIRSIGRISSAQSTSNLLNSDVTGNVNQPRAQTSSSVVRHRPNRRSNATTNDGVQQPENQQQAQESNNQRQRRGFTNSYDTRHRPQRRMNSATSNSNANNSSRSTTQANAPRLNFSMLSNLLEKSSDDILTGMLQPNFPLKAFLKDGRMEKNKEWTSAMTKLLEKITKCENSRERVAAVLRDLPGTSYIEGVYDLVRELDPISDQLRYEFIQSFLKISQSILNMIPSAADCLTKIIERVELYMTKTKKDLPEHQQTQELLDELIEHLKDIESRTRKNDRQRRTNDSNNGTTTTTIVSEQETRPPPDDYRQLPVIPSVTEILSEELVFLRRNIVDGIYDNPEHYLDIHFRLLREDFVGPLRDGIQQYLSGKEGKNFNVRVYQNVHSRGPRLNHRSGIVYELLLDANTASKISWINSRRLIYGNLLLLTFDQFQSCAFVTVEDRSNIGKDYTITVKKLESLNTQGQVSFELDDIDFSYPLVMIETMTYFEAYRPVLNALQIIPKDDTFPLAEFLLKLTHDKIPPNYVTPTTTYDFTPLLVPLDSKIKTNIVVHETMPLMVGRYRGPIKPIIEKEFRITYEKANQVPERYRRVQLLNKDQWPTSEQLHLNPKQHEALILALTNKVALIQGPPGTGKTFLGVRITEMLLHNRSVWCPKHEQSTPILMICHTNHALDQFLELTVKRLNITDGIIRVGNRCQNPTIQRFSLLSARRLSRESRAIPSNIYHKKHTIIDRKTDAEEQLKYHEDKIQKSQTNILGLSILTDYDIIDDRHRDSLLALFNGNHVESVLTEWLGITSKFDQQAEYLINLNDAEDSLSKIDLNENNETKNDEEEKVEDSKQEEAEINEEEEEEERRRDELEMEEDYFARPAPKQPQSTTKLNSMEVQIASKNEADVDSDGFQLVKKKQNPRQLIRYILQHPTKLTNATINDVNDNVWSLSLSQRYDLYRYWIYKYQQALHLEVRSTRNEYNQAVADLAEYHQEEDYYILKDSVIVAMTTTCAAKYHNVLEKLQNKIVIVEEAAAIFESHIITALSTKCEHLILIGDHVQLRPNPSVYQLAQKYQFDVSLFERLVKNQFPNVRLNIQHRMRPEISALMKHFYDDLDDHESVKTERPSVSGVDKDVYFLSHTEQETSVTDGSSKRNEFEARYAIALAEYLIKQGYQTSQITILVMYLGQRQYIAKHTRSKKILHGVRIMVTDNYQGEENDIIILSLVRSNHEKQIGFLKIHNRICVALSRARCGLFILGNSKLLAEVEPMWKNIGKTLFEAEAIGTRLCLSCRQHSKEKFYANSPESFLQRPEGGCNKPCDARLKCGHQCQLMCHNYDIEHKVIACRKKCNETLPCGHQCTKQCHATTPTQHAPCRILVDKTVVPCGHKIRFQCSQTPTSHDCTENLLKRLPCDHTVRVPCGIASSPAELRRFVCPEACNTMLSCKHKCPGTCGKCRTGQIHVPCEQKCGRELICSHVCRASCTSNCPPCLAKCETRCIHSECKEKCGKLCAPCKEPCAYKCKHLQCTRLCSEPCNRGPCNEPCEKKLPCGHDCIGICGEPCPPKCRICNKHIVEEIFFGTEDEPDARFVFLSDCKHIVEVKSLDNYIGGFLQNTPENTSIRFPECPRCKRQIRRCTRYMPIINRLNNLIAQVKKKILGNQSNVEIEKQRKDLIQEYEKFENNVKEIPIIKFKKFFEQLYDTDNIFSNDIFILMTNIIVFLDRIDKYLIEGRKRLSTNKFEDLIGPSLRHIIDYLLQHQKYRNLAEQQIQDIEFELKRIDRLIYIEAFHGALTETLKPNEKQDIDSMRILTTKSGPFTADDQQKFDSLAKKLEHLKNLPGLGITDKERQAIVSALNMGKGHWYVCPNGHPYAIGDCGGADQESTCPDCGAKIGGQHHRLTSDNRHFGLMDGSQYAAWSDEANQNMIPNFNNLF